jgi:methylmalonyl-CoA mutase
VSSERKLFDSFSPSTGSEWLAAATREGAHDLYWEPEPGIRVPSLVDPGDSLPNRCFEKHQAPEKSWLNIPRITVTDAHTANVTALEYLGLGADGVWFSLSVGCSPQELLGGIEPGYCSLAFSPDPGKEELLSRFIIQLADHARPLRGFIARPGVKPNDTLWEKIPGLKSCCISVSGAPASRALSSSLADGAKYLGAGGRPENVVFSAVVGRDFIAETAKLRALRFLWHQVCRAYGFNDSASAQSLVHGITEPFTAAGYEPRGNMIAETTMAVSAILGGCDVLTVLPSDDEPLSARAALHVSNLLREEAFFGRVSDPLCGTSLVGQYTDQLCRKAWAEFQRLMK